MNTSSIACVVLVGGSTALRVAYDPKVGDKIGAYGKIAVGGFALGAILALVASGAPGVASVLAWILTIAALMVNGPAVAKAAQSVLGR